MANLSFKLTPRIIQGDDLSAQGSSDGYVYIEYNNFYPAGTNVSAYRIEANLSLSNVTVNDDLSVTFTYGGIQYVRAYSRFSTAPVGYNVTKTLWDGDGNQKWQLASDIASSFDTGQIRVAGTEPKTYTVPANGSIDIPELKAFRWLSSAVVSDECEVFVGGKVTNIIPTYKPNGIRKNGEWKSVLELKLSTHIRKNGQWKDVGTENVSTIDATNEGNTRRRKNGTWKQESPFS